MEELRTLYTVLGLVTFFSLVLSIYFYTTIYRFSGGKTWIAAIAAGLTGSVLLSLRGKIPDLLSIHLGNIALIWMPALVGASFRRFMQLTTRPFPEYSLAIFFSIAFVVSAEYFTLQERLLTMDAAYFTLWIFPAWHSIQNYITDRKRSSPFLFALALTYSLLSGIRGIHDILRHPTNNFLAHDTCHLVNLYAILGIWFAITVSLAIFFSEQLSHALKENAAKLSDSLKLRDKLISVFAHDIKNAISASQLSLEELSEELQNSMCGECNPLLEIAKKQNDKVLNLLEKTISWAKSQNQNLKYNPVAISVTDAVQNALSFVQMQIHSKRLKIVQNIPDNLLFLADVETIVITLRNVIHNSVKFSHENGLISISAKPVDKKVELEISDNGIGMQADKIRELLSGSMVQSMQGTKGERGTGLGISIVKEYIAGNGGTMQIESELDKGTRIVLTLPAAS